MKLLITIKLFYLDPIRNLLGRSGKKFFKRFFMAKILIIEDSDSVRISLKNILTPDGHEVVEAVNGLDALSQLENAHDFDVILCDINMPEMNGMEFIKEQCNHESYSDIPTVMCTTESHPRLTQEAKQTGVVRAWLMKPFKPEILKATIERILKEKEAKRSAG